MVEKAATKREVTLAMIIRRARIKAGPKCVRKASHKAGVRFRRMRSKPLLTKRDIKDRWAFAQKYRKKSKKFWRNLSLSIDVKNFPVYLNPAALVVAAMREVRGAYRMKSQGLEENYVVVPKYLKFNTGAKSARISGGVGKGRMLLWHELKRQWNGKAAADLYLGPGRSALRRAWPRKRSFSMLEDNDPTGFKSIAGGKAKASAKIRVLEIPKRSPDLSVMDYAIWKQGTRTMRLQERRFKTTRKQETRAAFVARRDCVLPFGDGHGQKWLVGIHKTLDHCHRFFCHRLCSDFERV